METDAPLAIPISRDPYRSPILILAEPYKLKLKLAPDPESTSLNFLEFQLLVSTLNFPVATVPPRLLTIPPPLTK